MTRAIDFIREKEEMSAEAEAAKDKEIICECDNCGRNIYEWENDTIAVVAADGKSHQVYCQYCTARNDRFIKDVLEAAGIWVLSGWANKVVDNARAEVQRRKS